MNKYKVTFNPQVTTDDPVEIQADFFENEKNCINFLLLKERQVIAVFNVTTLLNVVKI